MLGAMGAPAGQAIGAARLASDCPAAVDATTALPLNDLHARIFAARGFIATANHNIQPKGYAPPLMFKTADTRFERITRRDELARADAQFAGNGLEVAALRRLSMPRARSGCC